MPYKEDLKSVVQNAAEGYYYLERQPSALPLPVKSEVKPSYLNPAPYFPNSFNIYHSSPPTKNNRFHLTPNQAPNWLPQSRRLRQAKAPRDLVPSKKKLAKQNLKIFLDFILQLNVPMKEKVEEAKLLGYTFPSQGPNDSPNDPLMHSSALKNWSWTVASPTHRARK